MSARTTALVVEREVREAARRKGVWALVALVFLGSTAIVVLPSILSSDTDTETIGVVGGDDAVGRQIVDVLEAIDDPRIETTELPDRAEAVDQIESGDIGLAVIFDPGDADRVDATRSAPVLVVENDDSDLVRTVAATISDQLVVTSLEDRGLDPDAVSDAFTSAQPTVQQVDDDRDGRQGAAFAITLVLYLLIVILASQVANGVAIEKSNRVSEVLLAIVPPRSLLYGKVIGVGLIGLVTLIAGALPVLIRQITSGGLPDGLAIVLLASGAWCVLGLALYLTLAGSLGALVGRQEEVGAIVTPLTMFLVVGYIAAISAGDSALGAVLAYVPFVSPMVEPHRIAVGAGSPVEYLISLALLIATVVVVSRFGTVVFRRAIVRTGGRVKLRDVVRAPTS